MSGRLSRPYDVEKWYEHFLPVMTRLHRQERRKMKAAERDLERVPSDDREATDNILRALYEIPVITQELCKAYETKRLRRQAERLLLWVPNHPRPAVDSADDQFWEQGEISGYWFFSTKGFEAVRGQVRKERSARWDVLIRWMTLAIGLIGAVTGLVAVLGN